MAKRFIDTNLFRSDFVKGLKPEYKLLWIYVINDCDHSGIWKTDFEVAELRLGIKIDLTKVEKSFEANIIPFDNGNKWFIPSFIDFQYGKLNLQNRVHNSVISNLKKFNLINEDLTIKPLTSPLQRAKDKDKDKDTDKDKDMDKDIEVAEIILDEWDELMKTWIDYRKEKKSTLTPSSIPKALKRLKKLSNEKIEVATEILDESISNGWLGLFALKTTLQTPQQNGKQQSGSATVEQITNKLGEAYKLIKTQ